MKKVFFLFVFALLISVNLYSQSVTALGNFILEQNNFTTTKNLLKSKGFTLFSSEELKVFGHNPNIVIIGTKGVNPSNSLMASITAISQTNSRIKEATFICSKVYADYLESDLSNTSYNKVKEREYVEGGRFKIIEKTYHRISGDNTDIAIIKFGEDGGAQIIFKNQKSIKK